MSRKNGGIIGPANTPVGGLMTGSASGVWRTNDLLNFVANNQWPQTPQNIENSCRFDDGNSDYLSRTPSSASNRRTWTFSTWVKLGNIGTEKGLLHSESDSNNYTAIRFSSDHRFKVLSARSGSTANGFYLITTRLFRDPSAWYHIVVAVDTTLGTATNRVRIYVNGVEETAFDTDTFGASQNYDTDINATSQQNVGDDNSGFHDGYLAETVLVDGQQLDATSFGEFDTTTGIWKPKKIGAFSSAGTNSFYLDFKDSSNLGNDASGLNNDFTVNNLTSIDQSTDTCVENYATFNSIAYGESGAAATFGNGNLDIIRGSASWRTAPTTIGALNKGKWYYECKAGTINASNAYIQVGVSSESAAFTNVDSYHDSNYSYAYHWDGSKYVNNSATASWGSAITTGDIVMIALDFDNNYIYAGLNGTWQNSGDPTSGSSGTGALSALQSGQNWFPTVSVYNTTHQANFGNPPYSISSGNSDANGHGNFEYSVPSGYYALNTSNLNTYG
jgi:hypothetical protein